MKNQCFKYETDEFVDYAANVCASNFLTRKLFNQFNFLSHSLRAAAYNFDTLTRYFASLEFVV